PDRTSADGEIGHGPRNVERAAIDFGQMLLVDIDEHDPPSGTDEMSTYNASDGARAPYEHFILAVCHCDLPRAMRLDDNQIEYILSALCGMWRGKFDGDF